MVLVDSSVWIDYFRGTKSPQTDRLDLILGSEPIATGDLILVEVLQGFQNEIHFDQARELLTSLVVIEMVGPSIAVQAAKNFRKLRALGITVRKTMDTLIATCCIESGLELLHCDRDFDPFVKHLGLRAISFD
jgi:predicted nucleic acid-binding protein